jgi:hypothetical protein
MRKSAGISQPLFGELTATDRRLGTVVQHEAQLRMSIDRRRGKLVDEDEKIVRQAAAGHRMCLGLPISILLTL